MVVNIMSVMIFQNVLHIERHCLGDSNQGYLVIFFGDCKQRYIIHYLCCQSEGMIDSRYLILLTIGFLHVSIRFETYDPSEQSVLCGVMTDDW